jgi:tRNA-dihydrouridine synthase
MIRAYFQMLLDEMESETEGIAANIKNMAEATGKMKQFASWFTHGVAGGATLRKNIYEAKNGEQVLAAVDAFFSRRDHAELAIEADALNLGTSQVVSA